MNREQSRRSRANAGRSNVRALALITIAVFILAAFFGMLIFRDHRASSSSSPTPVPTPTLAPATPAVTGVPPTATPISTSIPEVPTASAALDPTWAPPFIQSNNPDVAAAVETLLGQYDGVYGVLMMKPDGTVLYSKNSETPFVSASLYKLVLLADIHRKIESGAINPARVMPVLATDFEVNNGPDSFFTEANVGRTFTVERLLFATGSYSSNVAAKILLTLTTPSSLANETVLLGMTGTHLFVNPASLANWPPVAAPDSTAADVATAAAFAVQDASGSTTNLTTPADMARYFRLLLEGKIVSKNASSQILASLKAQVIDDRFPVLLPPDAEMAHKTGNLDHVVHDVGIIYSPAGPVILIAMVEADSDDNVATQIEQRLALLAFGTFDLPPIDLSIETPGVTPTDQSSTETPSDLPTATADGSSG